MATARIDKDNWARCARCGHKLARMVGNFPQGHHMMPAVEVKCHSCKEINYIMIGVARPMDSKDGQGR